MNTFLRTFMVLTICLILLNVFSFSPTASAQENRPAKGAGIHKDAQISMDKDGLTPAAFSFRDGHKPSVSTFLYEYRRTFRLSAENTLNSIEVSSDEIGQTHHRYQQYYNGIEVAEVQYLVHEKNDAVHLAHGKLIHGLDIDVHPTITEAAALQSALNFIDAERYMWESPKNEAFLKKLQDNPEATYYPKGELKISAGYQEKITENFRLVYRFEIFSQKPFACYAIEVDAHTGEIVCRIPLMYSGDVLGEGLTLYDGMVPITVSDQNFPVPTTLPPHGHLTGWNAYGGSGLSWWIANPNLGNEGGYNDLWYEVLETDSILLTGTNPQLSFHHRYKVEVPGNWGPYDAFDGMNVRISTDGGNTWEILINPTPAYTHNSLFGFGGVYGEGTNIPGWTGEQLTWTAVLFDLSVYAGQTVKLRFAFASDLSDCTVSTSALLLDLFGWQIDNIEVSSSAGTLYSNNGVSNNMIPLNLHQEATIIAGNYRLREIGRGNGIFTYDIQNTYSIALAVDIIDLDSSFVETSQGAGVSAHWCAENCYDYYLIDHGRDSYNNLGGRIISYVHFGDERAAFAGTAAVPPVLYFGDRSNNATPCVSLDFVGHEYAHLLTRYSARLIYTNESGALNESFSDMFGEAIETFGKGLPPDWLFGAEVYAIRSLSNPKLFNDPDTYLGQHWVPSTSNPSAANDYGGVHTNSGVQNYWFYLLSEGGSGVNDNDDYYSVTGVGLDDAAKIAYRNLTVYLMPSSQYYDSYDGAMWSAIDLFGSNSLQYRSVIEAWYAVGVYDSLATPFIYTSSDSLHLVAEVGVSSDTATFNIVNFGGPALIIDSLRLNSSLFQLVSPTVFPISLNYLDTVSIVISFSTTIPGIHQEILSIFCNDPNLPQANVQLVGKGYIIHPPTIGVIYAVSGYAANGSLFTLDANSGSAILIGESGFRHILGVSINPSTGELTGAVEAGSNTLLIRIDAQSGEAYGSMTIPIMIGRQGLAYDPNGDLYIVRYYNGQLYRIDPVTGIAALVGSVGFNLVSGLAINPVDSQLWGVRLTGDLYRIDKQSATSTLIGNTGFNNMEDIVFDETGQLFGIYGGSNEVSRLISIDPATAVGDTIGSTGVQGITGLAVRGVVPGITDITKEILPSVYELRQNYPNPFNPLTTIEFDLPKSSLVTLKVYNILGEEVATFVSARLSAGSYSYEWNASNVASGVYLYSLETESGFVQTMKMILMK